MSKATTRRPDGVPDKVWRAYQARHPKLRGEQQATLARVQALFGRELPADLAVRGWPAAPEGSIFEPGPEALAAVEGNAFEALVASAAEGPEPLRHWLSGCFYLDEIEGDGDCLFVALPPAKDGAGAPTAVVRWSHEEGMMTGELAKDLASFEVVWDLWNRRDELDDDELAEALAPVEGRWGAEWPLGDLAERLEADEADEEDEEDEDGDEDEADEEEEDEEEEDEEEEDEEDEDEEDEQPTWQFRQERAAWIVDALCGEEPSLPEGLLDDDLDDVLENTDLPRDVQMGLYWLLRTTLLGQDEPARALCERLSASPARMLRDAAAVVKEILDGERSQLGAIDDLATVRAQLAERARDPDGFDARQRREAAADHIRDVLAAVRAPLVLVALDEEPAGARWQGLADGAALLSLPGGDRVRVDWRGIAHVPAGVADPDEDAEDPDDDEDGEDDGDAPRVRMLDTIATGLGTIESAALRHDGRMLLTATSTALFEVELPGGATNGAWWEGVGTRTAAYATPDRVLAADSFGAVQLFDRRGSLLVPHNRYEPRTDDGGAFGVVAGGRIAIAGDGKETVLLGVYDDRLAELARLPMAATRVGSHGDHALVRDDQDVCWQLGGLAEAWAAGRPPAWQAPEVPRAQRLERDPRGTAPAVEPWPDAVHTRVVSGTRFAVVPDKDGFALVWEAGGKTRKVREIPFAPDHPRDPALLHVRVSPGGKRVAVWRNLDSWVRVYDLATGKQRASWESDAASGMVRDACWLDDDHVIWAHWQAFLSRVGEDEPLIEIESAWTSVAAAPGEGGRWLVAGIEQGDADGPQRMEVMILDDLAGDQDWFWRPKLALPERLATLHRDGDDVLLQVGDAWWRLDAVTAGEEEEEDDEDEDDDEDDEDE